MNRAPDDERLERAVLARIDAYMAAGAEEGSEDDDEQAPAPPPPAPIATGDTPPPQVPAPEAGRPPASLAGTAMALDLPPEVWKERGKLPFVPPDQVPPQKRAARTLQSLVVRSTLGETLPLDDDRILDNRRGAPLRERGRRGHRILPRPDPGPVHVALREARERPAAASAAIRRRYGVPNVASLHALHAQWRARLASRPEEWATFCEKFPDFIAFARAAAW